MNQNNGLPLSLKSYSRAAETAVRFDVCDSRPPLKIVRVVKQLHRLKSSELRFVCVAAACILCDDAHMLRGCSARRSNCTRLMSESSIVGEQLFSVASNALLVRRPVTIEIERFATHDVVARVGTHERDRESSEDIACGKTMADASGCDRYSDRSGFALRLAELEALRNQVAVATAKKRMFATCVVAHAHVTLDARYIRKRACSMLAHGALQKCARVGYRKVVTGGA
jgi:hypothetical protein